jgi:hypothetical protein
MVFFFKFDFELKECEQEQRAWFFWGVKKLVFKIGEQEIYICVYACVVGLCRIGLLSGAGCCPATVRFKFIS